MIAQQAALVVIDMQNGFLNDRSRHIVPVVAEIIDRWAEAGRDIIFTRYRNYPDSPFERLINWSSVRTSPEIDIIDDLAERAARARTIIDKQVYTMFTPEAAALVKAAGWTDLVFCGIATESCVLKSAVDAFELGYTPWIVVDACASHAGRDAHDAGLLVTRRFIGAGQLVSSAAIIANVAGSPTPAALDHP